MQINTKPWSQCADEHLTVQNLLSVPVKGRTLSLKVLVFLCSCPARPCDVSRREAVINGGSNSLVTAAYESS